MVKSAASTPEAYLKTLPSDRAKALRAVRKAIRVHLPKGYAENMNWGMISYEIPLKRYPNTYNKQPLMLAALANQKNYMAVYLMSVYGDTGIAKWFTEEWKKTGKKLNMGKSCIRFKKLEDVSLGLIGEVIGKVSVEKYIEHYEKVTKK